MPQTTPSRNPSFDLFLSHNSRDQDAVRAIAEKLRNQGVKCWFDEWALPAGQRWTSMLADGLMDSAACAVFFGEKGVGPWHNLEQELALSLSADAHQNGRFFGLIPVRLPGAPPWRDLDLPPFLRLYTWIDFDFIDDDRALRRLLAAVRAETPPPPLAADPAVAPYVGMRPLGEKDQPIFFGRDRYILDLLERFRVSKLPRFTNVLGASGSGKSSLLHAGLLPRLRSGALDGSDSWIYIIMRPGLDAMENLHTAMAGDATLRPHVSLSTKNPEAWLHCVALAALTSASDGPRLILLVDQFEEVFASRPNEPNAREKYDAEILRPFFRNLSYASRDPSGRVHVVAAMRRDFFNQFADDPDAGPILEDAESRLVVEAMNESELRYAIERPAVARGVEFDPGLIVTLIEDFRIQPAGSLPFLQEALHRLWEQREDNRMTLNSYVTMGRLRGAINSHAEKVIGVLDSHKRDLARPVFLHLVRLSDDGGDDTKRRVPLADLPGGESAMNLARQLSEEKSRLLTLDDANDGSAVASNAPDESGRAHVPTIEIAHEALLRGWTTLQKWIHNGREDRLVLRRIDVVARAWSAPGKEKPELLRGRELKTAWRVTKALSPEVGRSLHNFLAKSKSVARWRSVSAALGVLLLGFAFLLFGLLTVWFVIAQPRVNDMRNALNGDRVPSDAYKGLRRLPFCARIADELLAEFWMRQAVAGHRDEGVLYAARAGQFGVQFEGFADGLELLVRTVRHEKGVTSASFSPDGTRVVTVSQDNTARIWDASSGKPLGEPLRHEKVNGASFSPDGTRVVTSSHDNTARIWDAFFGKPLCDPLRHEDTVFSASFSPNGDRVVTASRDKTARIWDASSGKPLSAPLVHEGIVKSASFSPDGTRVVTASYDRTARIWDASSGKPLCDPLRHEDTVVSASFSPDGTRVVTASYDRTAQIWDAYSGKPLVKPLRHEKGVNGASFSPDGTRVVTASDDNTARIWNAYSGKPLGEPLRHEDSVFSASFSPDGTRVVTASEHTGRIWDASSGEPLSEPLVHEGNLMSASFSPNGTWVVTASGDNTARIWDASSRKPLHKPLSHEDKVIDASFSSDGTRVVTASDDKTARIWNASSGKPLGEPLRHDETVFSASFSPDGTRVVTASGDMTARVWDASSGKPVGEPLRHGSIVFSASFSPDGTRVVTASDDKTARIWNASSGKPVGEPLRHDDTVVNASFSPSGTRVVTASEDKTARIWDAFSGKPVGEPLRHAGFVITACFSPDGLRVVTSSQDETAWIWDAFSGKPVGEPLRHAGSVNSASFSPDGTRVVTASDDKTARIWDASSGKPLSERLWHEGIVMSASFSPDGTRVVTSTLSKIVVWSVTDGNLCARQVRWSERTGFDSDFAFHSGQGSSQLLVCDRWTPNSVVIRHIDLNPVGTRPGNYRSPSYLPLAEWERRLALRLEHPDDSTTVVPEISDRVRSAP